MDLIDFLGSNLLNYLQKVDKKAKTRDWNKYNKGFWHNFFLKLNEEKNGCIKVNCKGVTLHLEVESQRKNLELFINATIHNFNEYNKAQIPCVELWCSWAQRLLQGLWETKKKGKSTDVFSYLSALGSACILCYLKQVFQEVLCEFVEDLPASLR